MLSLQIAGGLLFSSVSLFFTPVYARIIYIFLANPKYRSLECYRIMTQIGIVQCLVAPGYFFMGVTHLLNGDPYQLAATVQKVGITCVRMEVVMSFLLALNRLKIICDLKYPAAIHTALLITCWIGGILYFAVLMTPFVGYTIIPGEFMGLYDKSRPFSAELKRVGFLIIAIASSLSLLCYMAILVHLVRLKWRTGQLAQSFHTEKKLLLYAVTRFAFDVQLSITFNFVGVSTAHPGAQLLLQLGNELNSLFLPPFLYLALNPALRAEFFKRSLSVTRVGTANQSSSLPPASTSHKNYSVQS